MAQNKNIRKDNRSITRTMEFLDSAATCSTSLVGERTCLVLNIGNFTTKKKAVLSVRRGKQSFYLLVMGYKTTCFLAASTYLKFEMHTGLRYIYA